MCGHVLVKSLAGVLISLALLTGVACGESPRCLFPRFAAVPKAPATHVGTPPVAGPRPYYGTALGATYYNWGYFGAHQHSQLISHGGYDNAFFEWGYARGY